MYKKHVAYMYYETGVNNSCKIILLVNLILAHLVEFSQNYKNGPDPVPHEKLLTLTLYLYDLY
jgi:hypothetical protein